MNPQEQEIDLMQNAHDMRLNELGNAPETPAAPAVIASTANYLVDEVPLDQLIGTDEEEEDLNPEQMEAENQLQQINNQVIPEGENQVFPEEAEFFDALTAENNQKIQQQAQNNNIQLGMALIRILTPDPVWTQAQNATATRLWAKFFSLGNTSNLHISILVDWANFFTFLLLSPGTFTWSKQLLASKLP